MFIRSLETRAACVTCRHQCNHREWADFFVDLYVTEGRSGFLSRLMVLIVFPVFGIYGVLSKTAVFFRRNSKGRDFSKFNQMITQQIQRGPCSGIVVYPEGTRNIKPEALPLKRGMVRYAYTEKFPIQVVITTNKEHILSQKMKKASFGTRCLVGYSDIVDPSEYSNFEAFFEKVKSTWDSEWKRFVWFSILSLTFLLVLIVLTRQCVSFWLDFIFGR